MRMHSPIDANDQFCCHYYGMSPNDIPYVSKRLVWTVFWNSVIAPDLDKVNLIKKLLSVKSQKGQISLFCESEVDFMIWFFMYFIMYFLCIFVYFLFLHCVFYLCT